MVEIILMLIFGSPIILGLVVAHHLDRRRWYVVYPDGERSRAMPYSAAKDYRAIFGGEVKRTKGRDNG